MVKTAASIFSPDEGGPLKRRKRERFATTVETYKTKVVSVERIPFPPQQKAIWTFNYPITVEGPMNFQLDINGFNPISIEQWSPNQIRALYAFFPLVDMPYSIDETPINITFDPPLLLPQSGLVTDP